MESLDGLSGLDLGDLLSPEVIESIPGMQDLINDGERHVSDVFENLIDEDAGDHLDPSATASASNSALRDDETATHDSDGSLDRRQIPRLNDTGIIPGYAEFIERINERAHNDLRGERTMLDQILDQEKLEDKNRQEALREYCQRIARYCFNKGQEDLEHQERLKQGAAVDSRDIPAESAGSLEHGPPLKACPWLDEKPRQEKYLNGWPHYLFDVNAGRTVETQTLDELPAYSAISHTWGRWRDHKEPPVDVKGIEWPIPQNRLFDVRRLPESLRKCKLNTQYIWLDLVCIPQNESEIAIQEIGRQADIFRNASLAIAWLHDVTDLSCLSAMFRWLALALLSFEPGSSDATKRDEMRNKEWLKIAHKHCGLLVPGEDYGPNADRELHPWFTSLWTLQELCLRPDMLLASSNWETFSVDENLRVPLNALIFVYGQFNNLFWPMSVFGTPAPTDQTETHFAFFELDHWLVRSGLHSLDKLKRIDILTLGDQRVCEMRRSEAIMSALGTTAWFHETERADQESNLVLGKYHPKFVEEVRAAIPGDFFLASQKTSSFRRKVTTLEQAAAEIALKKGKEPECGSLLPFSTSKAYYFPIPTLLPGEDNTHPSVRSWEIKQSGHVRIRKACILSSSTYDVPKEPEFLPCRFSGDAPRVIGEYDKDSILTFLLHQWIQVRKYEIHAVVTKCQTMFQTLDDEEVDWLCTVVGILLRKHDDGTFSLGGNFSARIRHMILLPAVSDVDWTVI